MINNSPQFDFQHALRASFSKEIIKQNGVGPIPLSISVSRSQERLVATDGVMQQWALTIGIQASLPQKDPIDLIQTIRYELHKDRARAFPAARQHAYRKAADKLAADAVRLLLFSPDLKGWV